MDKLVLALGPAFAAGLAVQRFLEIVDAIFNGFPKLGDYKKVAMAAASLVLAAGICSQPDIRILKYLLASQPAGYVDLLITILFISGGTEGLNALLKFLNYKKENAKGTAANTQSDADQKTIKGKDALTVVRGT